MTSLFSGTVSPSKDGTSSLPRRQNSLAKPPLRALYDLLIAPMEGVSGSWDTRLLGMGTHHFLLRAHARPPRALSGLTFFAGSLASPSLCFALRYTG